MLNIRKVLVAVLAALIVSLGIPSVSIAASDVTGTGKVTSDSLNVRSGPGKDFDVMGKVYSGNKIDIVGIDGDWLKIEYNNSEGYVSSEYVEYELDEVEEEIIEEEEPQPVEEIIEENETEDEPVYDYRIVFGIVGAIIVLIVMILITVRSIKKLDEDEYDEDEYDEDDEDDDEYEDDDDEYEDDDEDDEYDDEDSEDDDDEYEYVMVRRPKKNTTQSRPVKRSDDFSIDIDPRYFE